MALTQQELYEKYSLSEQGVEGALRKEGVKARVKKVSRSGSIYVQTKLGMIRLADHPLVNQIGDETVADFVAGKNLSKAEKEKFWVEKVVDFFDKKIPKTAWKEPTRWVNVPVDWLSFTWTVSWEDRRMVCSDRAYERLTGVDNKSTPAAVELFKTRFVQDLLFELRGRMGSRVNHWLGVIDEECEDNGEDWGEYLLGGRIGAALDRATGILAYCQGYSKSDISIAKAVQKLCLLIGGTTQGAAEETAAAMVAAAMKFSGEENYRYWENEAASRLLRRFEKETKPKEPSLRFVGSFFEEEHREYDLPSEEVLRIVTTTYGSVKTAVKYKGGRLVAGSHREAEELAKKLL